MSSLNARKPKTPLILICFCPILIQCPVWKFYLSQILPHTVKNYQVQCRNRLEHHSRSRYRKQKPQRTIYKYSLPRYKDICMLERPCIQKIISLKTIKKEIIGGNKGSLREIITKFQKMGKKKEIQTKIQLSSKNEKS